MTNSYYNHSTYPAPNAPGSSAALRAELDLVTDGFDKLPALAGNANKIVIVNASNTALDVTAVLPSLGVIDSTFLIQDDADATKKFQFQASGISPGTTRVLTIPNANLTIVGTDTTQTLTNKTLTSPAINTPALNGGTIDNAVIGGGTPAAATFTSLASSSATVSGVAVVTLSATQTLTNKTISGGTVTGAAVTGLSAPSGNSDAATKVYVDTADALKLNLSGGTLSGALAMGTNKITGLGTPTADTDAATKAYVDGVAQGLNVKASVRVATTANITLSGTQTIDGVSVIVGNRVLVKNQSTAANNGIYVVASGSWTRSTDMDAWTEFPGAFVFVEEGAVNDNAGWVCTANTGGTLGVTAVTFEQFSGAGQITAGAGLTKSGNTLDVGTASASRIVVNADNIDLATTGVSAATYKSVTVDAYGRVTAGTNPTTVSGYGLTDAYTKTEVDNSLALKLSLTGGTMSGNIAMGGSKVTGLGAPSASSDAVTLDYVTTLYGSTASAASSAADALTYKTAAESAATTATTQASTATTQAGIATTQAGIATTQASNALSSANAAAASFDSFDDRYLGAKNTPPMVDNDGNPLLTGALYFDTTTNEMKVYSGSAWLSAYIPTNNYVVGPASATDNAITRFDGTTGKLVQNSSATITDGGKLTANGGIATRATSTASASSLTPDVSTTDLYAYTALAANLAIAVPTGTPANGDKLLFRFLDNGVSRTITFTGGVSGGFRPIGVTLTSSGSDFTFTTTISKLTYIGAIYNADAARWDIVALTTQA